MPNAAAPRISLCIAILLRSLHTICITEVKAHPFQDKTCRKTTHTHNACLVVGNIHTQSAYPLRKPPFFFH